MGDSTKFSLAKLFHVKPDQLGSRNIFISNFELNKNVLNNF